MPMYKSLLIVTLTTYLEIKPKRISDSFGKMILELFIRLNRMTWQQEISKFTVKLLGFFFLPCYK